MDDSLVIHCIRALYWVILIGCFLVVALFFHSVADGVGYEGNKLLEAFSKNLVSLVFVTLACVAIVVVVRILFEMLLLASLESAKPEEHRTDDENSP
jgi:uncharacterized membrane protein